MPERTDTSKITVRHFNKSALDSLSANKEFNYGPEDLKSASSSWWARLGKFVMYLLSSIWNALFGRLQRVPYGASILKYGFLTAAVAFLIYFIFKAAGLDPFRLINGNSIKTSLVYSESLENIHLINFDAEIEKAVSQHNYRLAVRLMYLKCLKQLSDLNLIKWEINKTNAAYIYELTDPVQKQTFGILTRQFEYVWYGDFPIDQQAYGGINQLFQNFKKQLL